MFNAGNSFTLSLQKAEEADSGPLEVTAENSAGSCTVSVELQVLKGKRTTSRYACFGANVGTVDVYWNVHCSHTWHW